MRKTHLPRGFSLVELLVALGVSLMVIAGALALLISQQRMFQQSSGDRAVQETGRVALEEITSNLRLAGYGTDPSYAFDFGAMPAPIQDRTPQGVDLSAASTFASCTSVTCRDSITGPDEIVFRYRNPAFVRSLAAAPTGQASITIAGPLGAPLYQGQILQVICFGGDMLWAYVTVGQTVGITDANAVTVPLATGVADQFPFQNSYLANGCFSAVAARGANAATFAAAAKVYKVDQFRYYVATYDASGAVVANGTAGARPFLMLDQGLLDDGAPIRRVVAPDVEDLQFAYAFPASANPADQRVGATAGAAITADAAGIDVDPALGAPLFSDPTGAPRRATHFPANIRAVSVWVVARSPEVDSQLFEAMVPAAANRPAVAGPTGYRRQLFGTTATTPNLDARAPHFPTYSADGGADRFNVGGG
jgi:type IV pilus assembly protein PilW